MSQFPLCSEFIPLLDTVKKQLAELKNLSQEFLRSGDSETKQEAMLKGQELEKAKQRLVDSAEQPVEFEGETVVRIEKELITGFRSKTDSISLGYEIERNRVIEMSVHNTYKSAKITEAIESFLKFSKLFSKLRKLFCNNTQITNLPELPQGLQELFCQDNEITALPKLPHGLRVLCCPQTQITTLPDLPQSLEKLTCSYARITFLPDLPQGLQHFWCNDNKITDLPKLPMGLQRLECDNTLVAILPELPHGLSILNCSDTLVTSLPELPRSLENFNCSDTPVAKNPETKQYLEAFKQQHPKFNYVV